MKLLLKEFQRKKLKKNLIKNKVFFICNNTTISTEKFMRLEQKLKELNLSYYKVSNKLLKVFFKESIFKNYTNSISGPILFIEFRHLMNYHLLKILRELKIYNVNILYLHFRHKIYSTNQIKDLSHLNYKKTMVSFQNTLKNLLKIPSYKFLK